MWTPVHQVPFHSAKCPILCPSRPPLCGGAEAPAKKGRPHLFHRVRLVAPFQGLLLTDRGRSARPLDCCPFSQCVSKYENERSGRWRRRWEGRVSLRNDCFSRCNDWNRWCTGTSLKVEITSHGFPNKSQDNGIPRLLPTHDKKPVEHLEVYVKQYSRSCHIFMKKRKAFLMLSKG